MAKMKMGHDPVKHGYHKMDFGPDEKMNHRIEGAYAKQPKGSSSEGTKILGLAKHEQTSQFFSGGKKGMKK